MERKVLRLQMQKEHFIIYGDQARVGLTLYFIKCILPRKIFHRVYIIMNRMHINFPLFILPRAILLFTQSPISAAQAVAQIHDN